MLPLVDLSRFIREPERLAVLDETIRVVTFQPGPLGIVLGQQLGVPNADGRPPALMVRKTPQLQAAESGEIRKGDLLAAINGVHVPPGVLPNDLVTFLGRVGRPVKVAFRRVNPTPQTQTQTQSRRSSRRSSERREVEVALAARRWHGQDGAGWPGSRSVHSRRERHEPDGAGRRLRGVFHGRGRALEIVRRHGVGNALSRLRWQPEQQFGRRDGYGGKQSGGGGMDSSMILGGLKQLRTTRSALRDARRRRLRAAAHRGREVRRQTQRADAGGLPPVHVRRPPAAPRLDLRPALRVQLPRLLPIPHWRLEPRHQLPRARSIRSSSRSGRGGAVLVVVAVVAVANRRSCFRTLRIFHATRHRGHRH